MISNVCTFYMLYFHYLIMNCDRILLRRYQSECGELMLGAYDGRLCLCNWESEIHPGRIMSRLQRMLHADFDFGHSVVTDEAARQLDKYFSGLLTSFTMPLLFVGTSFQQVVWREVMEIPYGTTISYGDLAQRIGMPKSVRAVANANGANAISIFVPCHRICGSDGSLTGYSGGLEVKRFILSLEKHYQEDRM